MVVVTVVVVCVVVFVFGLVVVVVLGTELDTAQPNLVYSIIIVSELTFVDQDVWNLGKMIESKHTEIQI